MKAVSVLIVVCALMAMPVLAQSVPAPNSCSPVGTWYGGSEYKYIMTITPINGQTFAITSEAVVDNASSGYKAWTFVSGQMTKTTAKGYVGYGIGMFTTSSELPPPPNSYELDGVRAWMELVDCDTLQSTYDFFGAYFDLNKVPFVDPPDLNYLPPSGFVETYHRMPVTCPACSLPTAPTTKLRQKH